MTGVLRTAPVASRSGAQYDRLMQANYVQRIRLRFGKHGAARYISHLDLARAVERALNRSGLPVAYTQGYNPRPRVQFASALPLGFTSDCELADVWLHERVAPQQVQALLAPVMPPGLPLVGAVETPLEAPAMQAAIVEALYEVDAAGLLPGDELRRRVEALLAAETLVRERRGKAYDLRPLVLGLDLQAQAEGRELLTMRLAQLPGNTGRPDELLRAMGLDPLDVHVHRTRIVLQEEPD